MEGDVRSRFGRNSKSVAAFYLMELLNQFSDQYLKVDLWMYNGFADDIMEKLDKGLIDIGMLVEPVEIFKYDSIRLPYEDYRGLIIPDEPFIPIKKQCVKR